MFRRDIYVEARKKRHSKAYPHSTQARLSETGLLWIGQNAAKKGRTARKTRGGYKFRASFLDILRADSANKELCVEGKGRCKFEVGSNVNEYFL